LSDYKDEIEDIRHDDGFPYEETGEWHQVPRIDGTSTHNRIYRSIILKGGDWVGLDFSDLQLDYTTLSLARIAGSTFKGADFKASFNHCVVIGSDFSAAHFRRNDSQHTVFERCNFTQANIGEDYSFDRCAFIECVFAEIVLVPRAVFSRSLFRSCAMDAALEQRLRSFSNELQ